MVLCRMMVRVTPTAGVLIGLGLVLLTASGCGTSNKQEEVTFLGPPLEETADRGVALREPADEARVDELVEERAEDSAGVVDASVSEADEKVVETVNGSSEVAWTTRGAEAWGESSDSGVATIEPEMVEVVHREGVAKVVAEQSSVETEEPVNSSESASEPASEMMAVAEAEGVEAGVEEKDVQEEAEVGDEGEAEALMEGPALVSEDAAAVVDEGAEGTLTSEPELEPMFFVFGQVARPGPYKHTGKNRVLDIIAQVQPTKAADVRRVMLVRPSDEGEAEVFTIDTDRMVRQGDLSENYRLAAGDILYVPAGFPNRIGLGLKSMFTPAKDDAVAAQGQ